MAHSWVLARGYTACGNCGEALAEGKPALEIALNGVGGVRYRCEPCARAYDVLTEAMRQALYDAELHRVEREAMVEGPTFTPLRRMRPVRAPAAFATIADLFDAKARAAGSDQ